MSAEHAVAMVTAIDPPQPPKSRNKALPAGTLRKKGAPRPYRKVVEDVLASRIAKLSERLEKAKKQHESARVLLTKYAHERFYRERDAIVQAGPTVEPPAGPPALDNTLPLPAQA
jgi:hypothetical protein